LRAAQLCKVVIHAKNWLLAATRFAMTEIMSPKVADLAIKRGQRYVSDEKRNDAGSYEFFLAST